jgi:hypothetical protein
VALEETRHTPAHRGSGLCVWRGAVVSEAATPRPLQPAMNRLDGERPNGEPIVSVDGVSRMTFYAVFEDGSDCLLGAIEQSVTVGGERNQQANETRTEWMARIRGALVTLLEFCDQAPNQTRLFVIHSLQPAGNQPPSTGARASRRRQKPSRENPSGRMRGACHRQ